jgi:hypothetical protein
MMPMEARQVSLAPSFAPGRAKLFRTQKLVTLHPTLGESAKGENGIEERARAVLPPMAYEHWEATGTSAFSHLRKPSLIDSGAISAIKFV